MTEVSHEQNESWIVTVTTLSLFSKHQGHLVACEYSGENLVNVDVKPYFFFHSFVNFTFKQTAHITCTV